MPSDVTFEHFDHSADVCSIPSSRPLRARSQHFCFLSAFLFYLGLLPPPQCSFYFGEQWLGQQSSLINFGIWVQYVPGHTSASNHKCSRMLAEHPDLPAADDVISAREELACRQTQSAGLLPDRERKEKKRH